MMFVILCSLCIFSLNVVELIKIICGCHFLIWHFCIQFNVFQLFVFVCDENILLICFTKTPTQW